jgi:hypothetical protein
MADILESFAWGFNGVLQGAKKVAPRALAFNEIVELNRNLFLPVVEAGVEEISVALGQDRAEARAEIEQINEVVFDPLFGWYDEVYKSFIHWIEEVANIDLDRDGVIGFNDAEEILDDGIPEPAPEEEKKQV